MSDRTLLTSTRTAAGGFIAAVKTEKKIRQVVLAMGGAGVVCKFADIGYLQIWMVLLSWLLSLICEMFNTALEKTLDYASGKEYHPLIRQGKDYAAACTFLALCFAGTLTLFFLWARYFGLETEFSTQV